ncbi:MAG: dynamin family protein, partial [Porcipelethomonas sp.]
MSEYANYNTMVTTVCTGMQQLEDICSKLELTEIREALGASRKKLSSHKFSVGMLGEFKRGKSMVINSLLGDEILPSDIEPATATMNRVTYDINPHAELLMKDGSTKGVDIGDLKNYITKITKESAKNAAEIEEAIVYYPCPFCQNNVDIVDTPGLNDDERMNRITEEVIPKLDAVVMVLVHDNPFSSSEAEFVRTKLMTSDLGRIIFLVNKIDTIRKKDDVTRALDGIKKRIKETVLEKMKDMYGEDTEEYRQVAVKLDGIKVLPFSAFDAFDGKQQKDNALIEKSGTVEFERELTKMLTEDRGAIELGGPVSVISRYSKEIGTAAQLKKDALHQTEAELERTKEETIAAIEQARQDKKAEKKRIKAQSEKTCNDCIDMLNVFYGELKTKAYNAIDERLRD